VETNPQEKEGNTYLITPLHRPALDRGIAVCLWIAHLLHLPPAALPSHEATNIRDRKQAMGTAAIWTKRAAMITGIAFIGFGLWFVAAQGGPSDRSGNGFEVIALLALLQGILYLVPNRHLSVTLQRTLVYLALTMFPPFLSGFALVHQYLLKSVRIIASGPELAGLLIVTAVSLCAPLSLVIHYRQRHRR
jgi:hypothetical protein